MIGLVSMAAHYDWNFIIVLSGTIDNLRKQTRDRFFDDLTQSGGVSWHILDRTSNPDYMVDIKTKERYLLEDLHLNTYQDGKTSGKMCIRDREYGSNEAITRDTKRHMQKIRKTLDGKKKR